jgi:hypothetical protein
MRLVFDTVSPTLPFRRDSHQAVLGPSQWWRAAVVIVAGILLFQARCVGAQVDTKSWISALEHRPSYGWKNTTDIETGEITSVWTDVPPIDLKQEVIYTTGNDPKSDVSVNISRRLYVGCFDANLAITTFTREGRNWNPNECLTRCKKKLVNTTSYDIIVAVHQQRCACVENDITTFKEVDKSNCDFGCFPYLNPLCGGAPSYWGVFIEYEAQSFSSQGTYDPRRYIWFSIVTVSEKRIRGGYPPDQDQFGLPINPERYYLHAVDTQTGDAMYEYQQRIFGILYGLQYDIDSTRLVGLFTEQDTGRVRSDAVWQYKLMILRINTTFASEPQVTPMLIPLDIPTIMDSSKEYLAYNPATAINSQLDCFIFTQVQNAGFAYDMKEHLYIVNIIDGFIINDFELDFKVIQMFGNEKFGDISAIGPRYPRIAAGGLEGQNTFIHLARIAKNPLNDEINVYWMFDDPFNPKILIAETLTADWHLYPGVAASEHIYNKSAVMHSYEPPANNEFWRTIEITEVDIRNPDAVSNWCVAKTVQAGLFEEQLPCQGTVAYDIPFMSIYTKEPGIPLTLRSPRMTRAWFSLDASKITVDWSDSTLKGALYVDKNADGVPDADNPINYSFVPDGNFDCSQVFTKLTTELIGVWYPDDFESGTYCLWKSRSQIEIFLPNILNVTVGDDLFVKVNTIYRDPLDGPFGKEYSPAATDGVTVDAPDNLRPPLVVANGVLDLDQCSDLTVDISDSMYLGGDWWREISWSMVVSTADDPNPRDLTNNDTRTYDPAKNQSLYDLLREADKNNSRLLVIPSNIMEAAYAYRINVTITSRWKLTSSKILTVNKVGFSKPGIKLLQSSPLMKLSTERFSIQAACSVSDCAVEGASLAFRWLSIPPQGITDNAIAAALVIQPGTLLPPSENEVTDLDYHDYNFTAQCYVDSFAGNVPEKTAESTIMVRIERSAIYVKFRSDGRLITKGEDVLVIDVRESMDPDFPTRPGATFKGSFRFWCFEPEPDRMPCFGGATGEVLNAPTCRQDPGKKIIDGGTTYAKPIFDGDEYCQYARGVMMFRTDTLKVGQYKFDVEIRAYLGPTRTATATTLMQITDQDVPRFILEVLAPQEKYPINKQIKLFASEELQVGKTRNTSGVLRTYVWTIEALSDNPDYNNQLAAQTLNDPNAVYAIDKYVWLPAQINNKITDSNYFISSPNEPSLIIKGGTLLADKQYRVKMEFFPPDMVPRPYSVVQIQTAMSPPRPGTLTCTPMSATADSPRVLVADDWKVTGGNSPSYIFGYIRQGIGITTKNAFSTSAVPTKTYTIPQLPLGNADDQYSIQLYVDVYGDQYGSMTEYILEGVQSTKPANLTAATEKGLANAANANPADVNAELDYVLSMNPSDPAVQNSVLEVMQNSQQDIPQTPGQQTQTAQLIGTLVTNGNKGDGIMNAMEDLVLQASSTNSFSVDTTSPGGSLPALVFDTFGELMPEDQTAAGGQSISMKNYKEIQAYSRRFNSKDTGSGRRLSNHDLPPLGQPLTECPERFCDEPFLECVVGTVTKERYICCDADNKITACDDPPCWFHGVRCPIEPQKPGRMLHPKYSTNSKLQNQDNLASSHRPGAHPRRLTKPATPFNKAKTAEEVVAGLESEEIILTKTTRGMVAKKAEQADNMLRKESEEKVSFDSMTPALANKLRFESEQRQIAAADYNLELQRNKSQRITRITVMRDTVAKQLIRQLLQNEAPKEYESRSRTGKLIYTLRLGRTTDMSRVMPQFTFPTLFTVPFDSPIEPTPGNNVTGFSFVQVDYGSNIFSWSDSNPPSPDYMLMTLIVMKANTDDVTIRSIPETHDPIRVFANFDLMSNALCLYWDRFAPGTAGGAWSRQGIRNDARGCITSHLSDVGIFFDGSDPKPSPLVEAGIYYEREGMLKTCVGCDEKYNVAVIAMLGIAIFFCVLLIMLGFVMDETTRTHMMRQGAKSRYLLDGDGITAPLNVNDPIAYKYAGQKPIRLILGTIWNMTKREHALIGTIFYHELFTRPQRLQCLLSLICGLFAFNASVQSHPGYLSEARSWFVPGVLSGLLLYPMYCGFLLMFNMRPKAVKRRLIKKGATVKEVESLRDARDKLATETALMPKAMGITPKNPPPAMNWPGATTMLNMPSPLPLPPLPPGMAGGSMGETGMNSLPGMPAGMGGGMGGMGLAGMGGMLALPALPGRMAGGPLPPPPTYPPPPKDAGPVPVPGMPPNTFPKLGPPPAPFPQLPPSNAALQDGSLGGSMRPGIFNAFDNPALTGPVADTGATPQLADAPRPSGGPQPFRPPDPALMDNEIEAASLPPGVLQDDGMHTMMASSTPPDAPGTPVASGPPTPLGPEGTKPRKLSDTFGADGTFGASGTFGATGGTQATPPGTPPINSNIRFAPQHAMVPQGDGPMPLFIRAQPPPMMPAPFAPAPQGPCGATMWKMPGLPPPGMTPPIASVGGSGPAAVSMPKVFPPPPPPPREADQQFVRRIKYTYLDKVVREHQKFDMLEDPDELGTQTPGWVYDTMTLMPYLACCTFTIAAIFMILQYGVKFQEWQEKYWLYGSMAGMAVDLTVMEIFRMMMLTLVELRKYENRKKSKAGVFLPRRVPKEGYKGQIAPQPRLWKRATAKPPVPKGKILPMPKIPPPGGGGSGHIGLVGPGGNPLAPPPPPPPPKFSQNFSSAAMGYANTGMTGMPNLPSLRSNSPRSATSGQKFETPPRSRGQSPRQPGGVSPGGVSPANSLSGMQLSFNTVVQNGG